ncbi:MAG: DNA gyrase inhibitor YacG [Candidatus Omnitrophica bacterium]|nr:DNA gyrase inhibitor YacG [Candidatus Omnitrophota bacterium]MCA9445173.1 DNA gyrase inhibitor YacG [Candidatus Omnitrophota bacterium]MCB9767286.1 DNA gyrase inhibitor YacG [Candidatus Omnitrophota bacterium]
MSFMKCPTCKKTRSKFETHEFLPFCSERCKQADLGKWMVGEYKVSRPLRMDDEVSMEDMMREGSAPDRGYDYE